MHQIRPFNSTTNDYTAILAIWNANWPDRPETVEEWQRRDAERNPDLAFERFVIEHDQQIVGYTWYEEPDWSVGTGTYAIYYEVDPVHNSDEMHKRLCHHITQIVEDLPGADQLIMANQREDKPDKIALLQTIGFEEVMRHPISRLDVGAFEAAPYDQLLEKVQVSGITIRPLNEIQQADPDWTRQIYELDEAAFKTMPTMAEITGRSFEDYVKRFDHPGFDPAAWFIAVDEAASANHRYIGMSTIGFDPDNPEMMNQGFTGVHPNYRRRGIATALKVHTIAFAKEQGGKFIETGNADRNPMVQLNLKLGFEPLPAWVNMTKKLKTSKE